MLNVLKFKMTVPTVHMFLPRYVKAAQLTSDSKTAMVARYFAEKTLQEYSFLKYLPSTIAAASVSLALRVSQQPEWTPTLQHYTRYQEATIQPCMADIVNLIKKSTTASLQVRQATRAGRQQPNKETRWMNYGVLCFYYYVCRVLHRNEGLAGRKRRQKPFSSSSVD